MSSPAADPADLALAIELAEDAGASTLAWFQSATLAVEHKGDGSPVTAADLAAEARVRERLATTHPGAGIIGEEDDDGMQFHRRSEELGLEDVADEHVRAERQQEGE